jgi:hypothetical protein
MAYASALGKLQAVAGVDHLLSLLAEIQNEGARMELALSIARLIGDENHFIRLARETRADLGTSISQAVTALKRTIGKDQLVGELQTVLDDCADKMAREDFSHGVRLLSEVIQQLPQESFSDTSNVILRACVEQLTEDQLTRREYILLALHVANKGWIS